MKLSLIFSAFLLAPHALGAALPADFHYDELVITNSTTYPLNDDAFLCDPSHTLCKRKGGGGKSGGGGGSKTSGGSGGGGKIPSIPAGGRGGSVGHPTSRGAGKAYGGGGGAVYTAAPVAFVMAGFWAVYTLDVAAFWAGPWWYHPMYVYPFDPSYSWTYYNSTLKRNETKPVACVCSYYQSCTCRATNDTAFIADLVKNGTFQDLNQTMITVADLKVNGTGVTQSTLVLNGTVANGTSSVSAAPSTKAAHSMVAITVALAVYFALAL